MWTPSGESWKTNSHLTDLPITHKTIKQLDNSKKCFCFLNNKKAAKKVQNLIGKEVCRSPKNRG
jgi:hypothetical protein